MGAGKEVPISKNIPAVAGRKNEMMRGERGEYAAMGRLRS
jgi:hypothetical protein